MNSQKSALRIGIVGAGLAGLSVALALQARKDFQGEVHLFEPREQYVHDRHWSFWRVADHLFSKLSQTQFQAVEFFSYSKSRTLASSSMPYCVLSSGAVYTFCQKILQQDQRFKLHMGQKVAKIVATENKHLEIVINGEKSKTFDLVFDSRPLQATTLNGFRQWFIGAEIASTQAMKNFRPRLMDFCLKSPQPIGFFYALPLDAARVLVQLTYFLAPGEAPPNNARAIWHDYVVNTLGLDPSSALREENGIIPMQIMPAAEQTFGCHLIGTPAGWIRAATGYGFLDIQRAAQRVAKACCISAPAEREHILRSVRARSGWDDKLDTIFLTTLQREPQRAAEFFSAIFSNDATTDSVIRFLSGTGTWRDRLKIMWALPALPFLKSVLLSGKK